MCVRPIIARLPSLSLPQIPNLEVVATITLLASWMVGERRAKVLTEVGGVFKKLWGVFFLAAALFSGCGE